MLCTPCLVAPCVIEIGHARVYTVNIRNNPVRVYKFYGTENPVHPKYEISDEQHIYVFKKELNQAIFEISIHHDLKL